MNGQQKGVEVGLLEKTERRSRDSAVRNQLILSDKC